MNKVTLIVLVQKVQLNDPKCPNGFKVLYRNTVECQLEDVDFTSLYETLRFLYPDKSNIIEFSIHE